MDASPTSAELEDVVPTHHAWATTTAFGLLLTGITLLASSVHLLVVGAFAGPVVVLPVIGVVCAVTGILARRAGRRGLMAALVLSVLVLLGNLGHMADTLRLPASPWDFVPNLAAGMGLVLAATAAVAGLRRRSVTATTERRLRAGTLAVLTVGTATSLGLALGTAAALPADAVVVTTTDNAYAPDAVEVVAGDVVGVDNRDAYGHTFTVTDLDLDVGVAGGATATVPIDADTPPGTYEITCVLHPGIMEATLSVTTP